MTLSSSGFIFSLLLLGISDNLYGAEPFNYGPDSSKNLVLGNSTSDNTFKSDTSPESFKHANPDTTNSSSSDTSPQTRIDPGPTSSTSQRRVQR